MVKRSLLNTLNSYHVERIDTWYGLILSIHTTLNGLILSIDTTLNGLILSIHTTLFEESIMELEQYVGEKRADVIKQDLSGLGRKILLRAQEDGYSMWRLSRVFGINYTTLLSIRDGKTDIPSAVTMECLLLLDEYLEREGKK